MKNKMVAFMLILLFTACQQTNIENDSIAEITENQKVIVTQEKMTPESIDDIDKDFIEERLNGMDYTFTGYEVTFFINFVDKSELTLSVEGNDNKVLNERVYELMQLLYNTYKADFYTIIITDKNTSKVYKFVEPPSRLKRIFNGEIAQDRWFRPALEIPDTEP